MRRIALGVAALAVIAGVARADTPAAEVVASGHSFSPETITISVGQTVHWTDGGGFHNVAFDDGSFRSGDPSATLDTSHTFDKAGTYTYFCEVHKSQGMTGTVVVGGGAAATPTPIATAAPPNVTILEVGKAIHHGKLEGSLKASPTGARVKITARGANATSVLARAGKVKFSLTLTKASRKTLRAEGSLQLTVVAKVKSGGTTSTAGTTVTVG